MLKRWMSPYSAHLAFHNVLELARVSIHVLGDDAFRPVEDDADGRAIVIRRALALEA